MSLVLLYNINNGQNLSQKAQNQQGIKRLIEIIKRQGICKELYIEIINLSLRVHNLDLSTTAIPFPIIINAITYSTVVEYKKKNLILFKRKGSTKEPR